jgi:hypothetical protein
MLVEFERAPRPQQQVILPESGEDEGFGQVVTQQEPQAPRPLMVNPMFVAMFFESNTPGISVIKGPDGRGFLVVGTFEQVKAKLETAGMQRAADEAVN